MSTQRKKIAAGNWKMNTTLPEAVKLATEIKHSPVSSGALLILAPPFPFLAAVAEAVKGSAIAIAAQDCSAEESGARTGEVSAAMLRSAGASHVIIGHSERRQYHNENGELLAKKISQAIKHNLVPIYCVGEQLKERQAGQHFEVVKKQLEEAPFSINHFPLTIIAYEPVWAIGTGQTATPAQAQEMHAFIRSLLEKKYGAAAAAATSILYGGSCNAGNAKELFACADIDGGLIGGASLKSAEFVSIASSF